MWGEKINWYSASRISAELMFFMSRIAHLVEQNQKAESPILRAESAQPYQERGWHGHSIFIYH